jgi:hypothetical protein
VQTSAQAETAGAFESPDVEAELRKWNWGAFLLSWIWAIGNRVWIGLLALIPIVGLVMMFVLGIKGNRWAWEKKRWRDIEDFHRTQRKWAIAGLVFLVLTVLLGVVLAIAGGETQTTTLG